jgi:hypothetical protein
LRFRYSTIDHTKGAWHVVVRGKWDKAGNYPGINAKLMLATLPAILARQLGCPRRQIDHHLLDHRGRCTYLVQRPHEP